MMLNIQRILAQESEWSHLVRKSSGDLGSPPGSGTTLDESLFVLMNETYKPFKIEQTELVPNDMSYF